MTIDFLLTTWSINLSIFKASSIPESTKNVNFGIFLIRNLVEIIFLSLPLEERKALKTSSWVYDSKNKITYILALDKSGETETLVIDTYEAILGSDRSLLIALANTLRIE